MSDAPATAGEVVGLRPCLPWPLSRWRWWTVPVPAERLAALRIGIAAVLLVDLLTTYWPYVGDLFGANSLGQPSLFAWRWWPKYWYWSVLRGVESPTALRLAMAVWTICTVGLLVGWHTRACAVLTWAVSTSFANLNPNVDNAGDTIRGIILFYLMLCPSGAAWSFDARRARRTRPALVHPWPLRLLFVQMVVIYFCNGVHKAKGIDWPAGDSLYYVLADLSLTRWSYAGVPVPYWMTKGLTWLVLGWEIGFPVLVLWRPLRFIALAFGVLFHLGIWLSMELGNFAPYMLCLYLPLLPLGERPPRARPTSPAPPSEAPHQAQAPAPA